MRNLEQSSTIKEYPGLTSLFNFNIFFFKSKQRKLTWRSFYEKQEPDSANIHSYLRNSELGLFNDGSRRKAKGSVIGASIQTLPSLYKEHKFTLENHDKVFKSYWISDNQVIVSTKNNILTVIDVRTDKRTSIPLIHPRRLEGQECDIENPNMIKPCGIYHIASNPKRSLLATGASDSKGIAIYKLPTFDPYCVLEGHVDIVFSVQWISDDMLVSCGKDSSVALWKVPNRLQHSVCGSDIEPISPVIVRTEHTSKVRDLKYNTSTKEFMTLSADASCKLWDSFTMKTKSSISLSELKEAVCMDIDAKSNLYAIGSQKNVQLLDPRISKSVHSIESLDEGFGVRSLAWKDHLLTIAGGIGRISFYDLRNQKYLQVQTDRVSPRDNYFQCGLGWVKQDEIYQNFFYRNSVPNAIYTLSYDESQTRLFAAGGPLQIGLKGSYAALYQ